MSEELQLCKPGEHDFRFVDKTRNGYYMGEKTILFLYCTKCGYTKNLKQEGKSE